MREVVTSRPFEVEIHHVNLGTGRTLRDWPPNLVGTLLDASVGAFRARADVPPLLTEPDGQRTPVVLGEGTPATVVGASRCDVLIWLLGRSHGRDIGVGSDKPPPRLPNLYYVFGPPDVLDSRPTL